MDCQPSYDFDKEKIMPKLTLKTPLMHKERPKLLGETYIRPCELFSHDEKVAFEIKRDKISTNKREIMLSNFEKS